MSVLKNLIKAGSTATSIAAPIVAGAVGGPAAAMAAGTAAGALNKKIQGMPDRGLGRGASSLQQARSQDKARMKRSYGI